MLLPWAAYVVDAKGRKFGNAYSTIKRNVAQEIPDRRIVELNKRYGLKNKTILEVGCFEGIHTIALANQGANVVAVDGRIENVLKTIVRCHFFDVVAKVQWWDLEKNKPANVTSKCDILHHVGVLYHLADPIAHLDTLLDDVGSVIMLDTHVAPHTGERVRTNHKDFGYSCTLFNESGREAPFAGLTPTARWVDSNDLLSFVKSKGFSHAEIAEHRDERNGPRVLIFAHR
jgi:tRNA (mo5U34)-methyltransferase